MGRTRMEWRSHIAKKWAIAQGLDEAPDWSAMPRRKMMDEIGLKLHHILGKNEEEAWEFIDGWIDAGCPAIAKKYPYKLTPEQLRWVIEQLSLELPPSYRAIGARVGISGQRVGVIAQRLREEKL